MAPGLRVPRTLQYLEDYYELRVLAGEAALEHGEAKTRAIFKRKRGFVHYWKRKVENTSSSYTCSTPSLIFIVHMLNSITHLHRTHAQLHHSSTHFLPSA